MNKKIIIGLLLCIGLSGCLTAPKPQNTATTATDTNNKTAETGPANVYDPSKQVRPVPIPEGLAKQTEKTEVEPAKPAVIEPTIPLKDSIPKNTEISTNKTKGDSLDGNDSSNSASLFPNTNIPITSKKSTQPSYNMEGNLDKGKAFFPITDTQKQAIDETNDKTSPEDKQDGSITNDLSTKVSSKISGSYVAWTSKTSDDYNVYTKNLKTNIIGRFSATLPSNSIDTNVVDKSDQNLEFLNSEFIVWQENPFSKNSKKEFYYSPLIKTVINKITLTFQEAVALDSQNNLLLLNSIEKDKFLFTIFNLKTGKKSDFAFNFPNTQKEYEYVAFEYPNIYLLEQGSESVSKLINFDISNNSYNILTVLVNKAPTGELVNRQFIKLFGNELMYLEVISGKNANLKIYNLRNDKTETVAENINQDDTSLENITELDFNDLYITWAITHSTAKKNNIYLLKRKTGETKTLLMPEKGINLDWNTTGFNYNNQILNDRNLVFIGYKKTPTANQVYLLDL